MFFGQCRQNLTVEIPPPTRRRRRSLSFPASLTPLRLSAESSLEKSVGSSRSSDPREALPPLEKSERQSGRSSGGSRSSSSGPEGASYWLRRPLPTPNLPLALPLYPYPNTLSLYPYPHSYTGRASKPASLRGSASAASPSELRAPSLSPLGPSRWSIQALLDDAPGG